MKASRSFALRLTLLVTYVTAFALVLVSGAHVFLEVRRVRDGALEFVGAQARVIAANSTAPLDFDDPDAAASTLQGLSTVAEFAAAEVHKAVEGGDRLFAAYRRDTGEEVPSLEGAREPQIRGRWLVYPQPIIRDGQRIGELRLLYDFARQRRRLILEAGAAVGIAGFALALSFVAARRIQRSLLRPVVELSRAAHAIATSDDYSVRAVKVSEDELGALTDVFNGMVARIGEAEALRRNHQQMLEAEVARRSAEVLETQARLRQSERMASLGTLSAGLGHDIGNILMPLRAHLSAIRERLGPGDAAEADFAAVTQATQYLHNLSTSLRMLSQESGSPEAAREPTHLPTWWAELEPILGAMLGRGIILEHDIPPDLPPVLLSKSLLMQAVFNLVQNAGQALVPEGGRAAAGARVRVSARPKGERRIAVEVSDNGPGMPDEVRRRCLEPYFTTKTRRISSGLGLSLVRGIIESAGGEIGLETAPGQGTTFTLTLPAQTLHAREPKPVAFVTLSEPRRRAIVTHLLGTMNFDVKPQSPAPEMNGASPHAALWVTDSVQSVPGTWHGPIVLMSMTDGAALDPQSRITVIDPGTPLPALRHVFRQLLPGVT
jgi:signal transduction histidine kinase